MKTIYLTLFGLMMSICAKAQYESYSVLADRAQDKLHNSFRSTNGSYYIENNGTSNTYFHYWWNAHALDVLVDAYLRTSDSKYVTRINTLVNNWSSNNGGSIYNDYYDDMEWFALSLFRAYEATGNGTFLTISTDLWNDIKTGENNNQGGGIAWRKTQLDYKNTPANAPAIIYACRRHQKWGHSWELTLATNLYTWLKNTLRESSGRINDGINRTGNSAIDYWQFTYNYGVFIGAALEMYQSTNNSAYLNDAIQTADFAIQSTELSTNGIFRNEGNGDAALFKGILVRYLALLANESAVPIAKRDAYKAVLEAQAQSIHATGFNRTYNLIGVDWATTPGSATWMSAHLSGIMMLEIAADLGFSAPVPPVTVYEHCSYTGSSVPLGVGSYTLSQLQALGVANDQVSSIKVQSGYQATLYQHHDFTGTSLVKSGDDTCLADDGFNDELSSIVISQVSTSRLGQDTVLNDEPNANIKSASGIDKQGNDLALSETDLVRTAFFPNPVVSGNFLKIQTGSHINHVEITLFDLTGRRFLHDAAQVSNGGVFISTAGLNPGSYILRLVENGVNVMTSKLMVK
ncbi:glycoside hydrolase family 76 protein [Fulvivirgaceae bacterium BMA12]|uniref:Glycoside hydrolase family 76 protein n=1 Tax=Agaribacillus aureus TaxID=3051825 RepID=A0ABT8KZC8_9BACT|nr:glycoside hydrolase family 76 protein [Fulvivirgaceae bacterium BMA12]